MTEWRQYKYISILFQNNSTHEGLKFLCWNQNIPGELDQYHTTKDIMISDMQDNGVFLLPAHSQG